MQIISILFGKGSTIHYICELLIHIFSMSSSQLIKNSLIFSLYNDNRSVFRLIDVSMLTKEVNFISLNKSLNYFVKTNKIQNPRKGIYTKANYDKEEMACRVFIPSYISLDYVLQKAGIIFQYNPQITSISYLSRNIDVENVEYSYRKIKDEIMVDMTGIDRRSNGVNIASPERAFLDSLYLNGEQYFDNLNPLNKEIVQSLLPIYNSKILTQRVNKLLIK